MNKIIFLGVITFIIASIIAIIVSIKILKYYERLDKKDSIKYIKK